MNRKSSATLAALVLCASTPSFAALVKLDFEGINDYSQVDQYYNGGTDSPAGSADIPVTGPKYGIYFGPDAVSFATGGSFGNALIATGPSASLFAAPGGSFSGAIAFSYYALMGFDVEIRDAASNPMQTLKLGASSASNLCSVADATCWASGSYAFNGNAASFAFGPTFVQGESIAAFDNIAVTVPEPGMAALLLSGLAMIGGARLRRRQTTAV